MSLRIDDVPPAAEAEVSAEGEVRGDESDTAERDVVEAEVVAPRQDRRGRWGSAIAFAILPIVAMLLTAGLGYLKWLESTAQAAQAAASQSVRVATEDTIAMLSYRPDTVEKDLTTAIDRTTGTFRDSYARLINDVVIPGAKEKKVSAVATVPAAASVSAAENRAVVLVFVNQTTTIANNAPTFTTSSVRVTLERVNAKWLVSQFDPI